MSSKSQSCLPTGQKDSEAGVIRVKLEEVNLDIDTDYCFSPSASPNCEERDNVWSLKENQLAQDGANPTVESDAMRESHAVSTDTAKNEHLEETGRMAFESVPIVERKVKVEVDVSGATLPTPEDYEPPRKIKKISAKLDSVRPATCVKCKIGFPNTDLLEHHMNTAHQDERPFSCRHCRKRFLTLSHCRRHESIHNPKRWEGEPQFQCDICPKRYHLWLSLASHRKHIHFGYKPRKRPKTAPVKMHISKGTKNPNTNQSPKQELPCPHCDLKVGKPSELKRHMLCHTNERPFSCHICQNQFKEQKNLKIHIRNVHKRPSSTEVHHSTPKWKAKQPCPCSVCGKVFQIASQLRYHISIHSGELPHKCTTCGKRFRLIHQLTQHIKMRHPPELRAKNPLKFYKCLICGKDKFRLYSDFRGHRMHHHAHIPYDGEKEKPFACGVCGKPHFLREDAIICASLRHDPYTLLQAMFKIKCSECPKETLGFWNLSTLRKHWGDEHGGKTLPAKFRMGLYNNPTLRKEKLPKCTVDKKKVESWKANGIPPDVEQSETPLFIELPLLPIPEEEQFRKKTPKANPKPPSEPKIWECELCGARVSTKSHLKRHMETVHDPLKEKSCPMCRKMFRKVSTLEAHKKTHFQPKRQVGRSTKIQKIEHVPPDASIMVGADKRNHVKHKIAFQQTVNIHDAAVVAKALNYQVVRVALFKWAFPQGMLDKCKRALV